MQFSILFRAGSIAALVALAPLSSPAQQPPGFSGLRISPAAPTRSSTQTFGNRGQLVEFDAPGAATQPAQICQPYCGTVPFANNDAGAIVGTYTDQYIVPHGFVRAPNGIVTSFDAPGAGLGHGLNEGTVAYSINTQGVIDGEFQDSQLVFHGFLRSVAGTFTTIDVPGAGGGPNQGTVTWDVNGSGSTTGYFVDPSGVFHGFVRSAVGTVTPFDPTGSVFTEVCAETCINDAGAITGFYDDANGVVHGFLRRPSGSIVPIDAPGAGTGSGQGTIAASINPAGGITGYFADANSQLHGFVRNANGTFVVFDAPGVIATAAISIDASWSAAGSGISANGTLVGFSRSPRGVFTEFYAPDAGRSKGRGTRPSTNNAAGEITGWYIDVNELDHGFVWTPPASPER
jgi:hypothetical protein